MVVAHEIGIADKIQGVMTNPRTESEKLLPLNPLSKIPVLVTDAGETIYDSPVICEYLDTEFGDQKLLPPKGKLRWEVLTIAALADGILDAAILGRNERLREEGTKSAEAIEWQMKRIRTGLDRLERIVPSLAGAFDLRHVGIGCALGYLDYRMREEGFFDARPKLKDWFAAAMQRPSFQKTMPTG
jgi:glutathione S-transferase